MKQKTFALWTLAGLTAALLAGCSVKFSAQLGMSPKSSAAPDTDKPAKAAPGSKPAAAGKPEDRDAKPAEAKKGKTIADVVGKDRKIEGLFTLYENSTNGSVHLVLKKDQLGKEFVYFTHTVDGVTAAGHFRGAFRDTAVFSLKKHFNRIEFVSENTAFYFAPSNALSRAASANISPAILTSQEIVAEDSDKGEFLIKADGIFLTEAFHQVKSSSGGRGGGSGAGFSLGTLSKDKTKYIGLRSYPKNTDVLVEYVYDNASPTGAGGRDVTDPRYVSIRMQHSLIEMPQNDYQPRFDDPRVGYFASQITDLTSPSATPYRDAIHRWHLVKKDKKAALSEPVEPITWWIENTTPVELRDTIRDATLAWNEAFEAAGFKNAVTVKVQPDNADWDAGDIRYNVLRWTSSPNPPFGGYGPSFVNPRTGQILGADIMLEYTFLANRMRLERIFSEAGLFLHEPDPALDQGDRHFCSLGHCLQQNTLFGIHALTAADMGQVEVTALIKDALYYLILHEVGHTLGLNHNMRSSQMIPPADIHNREVTEKRGLTGSVMDYPPVNIALPGQPQGQYYTTRPGPYDKWAIEFGYSEALGDPSAEKARLEKVLSRSTEPALAFGNDADDMRAPGKAIDPRVMINDMSADAINYAEGRIQLVRETLRKLRDKFARPGQSHHELRTAYLSTTTEFANAVAVISRYIGGVQVDRAFVAQPGATQPFTPVPLADQKRAMRILREQLFAPGAFDAPENLYNHLQMQRRGFEFISATEDPKIHERALNIHRAVLSHLLHPSVLARLTDTRLYGNAYSPAECLTDLTEAVFAADAQGDVNTFRQNLQLEYVNRLIQIVGRDGNSTYDYPSRSAALAQLRGVESLLKPKQAGNAETRAHTQHVLFAIAQALKLD